MDKIITEWAVTAFSNLNFTIQNFTIRNLTIGLRFHTAESREMLEFFKLIPIKSVS